MSQTPAPPPPPGQFGAPSYGSHPVEPPKKSKPWLLFIGLPLLLLSLILCLLGGFKAAQTFMGAGDAEAQNGESTHTLSAGDNRGIWIAPGTSGSCIVLDPDGQEVTLEKPDGEQSVDFNGEKLALASVFGAEKDGEYTVNCDIEYRVAEVVSTGSMVTLGISTLLCCLGLPLTIIGLILWLRRRKQ